MKDIGGEGRKSSTVLTDARLRVCSSRVGPMNTPSWELANLALNCAIHTTAPLGVLCLHFYRRFSVTQIHTASIHAFSLRAHTNQARAVSKTLLMGSGVGRCSAQHCWLDRPPCSLLLVLSDLRHRSRSA